MEARTPYYWIDKLTNFMIVLFYYYILLCIVSNEVPEHPCVSPSSNCVFERRLIEKYIAENGTDPISGEPISEEQLIDIKGKVIVMDCILL